MAGNRYQRARLEQREKFSCWLYTQVLIPLVCIGVCALGSYLKGPPACASRLIGNGGLLFFGAMLCLGIVAEYWVLHKVNLEIAQQAFHSHLGLMNLTIAVGLLFLYALVYADRSSTVGGAPSAQARTGEVWDMWCCVAGGAFAVGLATVSLVYSEYRVLRSLREQADKKKA